MGLLLDALIYAGFLATPLAGFAVMQAPLRSGLFTAGTERRAVPLFLTTGEYFTYRSRFHELVVMAGFFLGWVTALGAYVYLLDMYYFGGG